jgi:hypothetical protein
MNMTAEDLVERLVVFALAQKPHALNADVRIATLWPMMDLDTGAAVACNSGSFPSSGFVRWYRVVNGDWLDGDLVIGLLRRNDDNGFRVDGKEWYQVFGDSGEHAGHRICELFTIPQKLSNLKAILRHPVSMNRIPRSEVYLYCEDAVVGPFRASEVTTRSGRAALFAPDRSAEGDVDVYDRQEFDNSGVAIVRTAAVLSSTEFAPTHHSSGIYQTQYQIFRKHDLNSASLTKSTRFYLSDELLVTKACKHLPHGKSWKKLRDELKPLVAMLSENPPGVTQAMIDGLPELLREAERRVEWTELLLNAVVQDERFEKRIAEQVKLLVDSRVQEMAEGIETKAKEITRSKLLEIERAEEKVVQLETQKQKLEKQIGELDDKQAECELRIEELMSGVAKRLQEGRSELLSELALLGPMFHGGITHASSSGHIETSPRPVVNTEPEHQSQLPLKLPEVASPQSPSLDEVAFVKTRLWPCLANRGCGLGRRDTEFFHATILAGRLIGIPHPGWAVGYAEAMGGAAQATIVSASPDWLSFKLAFANGLSNAWQNAVADFSRLQIVVIEGIDRCPSHAWLGPWLSILAGWSEVLPDRDQLRWPAHVRLCVTRERSRACFDVPFEVNEWILEFDASSSEEIAPAIATGHFSLSDWKLPDTAAHDEAFDGFIKSLELPMSKPFSPYRYQLACRLRQALMRLCPDEGPPNPRTISGRLFRCWEREVAK